MVACSYCREAGHNIRTCKVKQYKSNPPEPLPITIVTPPKTHDSQKPDEKKTLTGVIKSIKENKHNDNEKGEKIKKDETSKISKASHHKGYIYIYKLDQPKSEEIDLYKVGCTKRLPVRRIEEQEKHNGEKYTCIKSLSVSNRKMAEKLIHLELKKHNFKRDVKDGKTEWFKCDRENLIQVFNLSARLVNMFYENYMNEEGEFVRASI